MAAAVQWTVVLVPQKIHQSAYVPVAKVEMTEVAALLDSVVQRLIKNLNEATHTGEVFVHLSSGGKIAEMIKNRT